MTLKLLNLNNKTSYIFIFCLLCSANHTKNHANNTNINVIKAGSPCLIKMLFEAE